MPGLSADSRANAGGIIFALIILALFLVIGLTAVNASYTESADQQTVNETFTADPGNVTTLNNSNLDDAIYEPLVTVEGSNGQLAVEGSDYVWYESNGTVRALSGGKLSDGEQATIQYTYAAPSSTARGFLSIVLGTFDVLALLPLLLMAFAALAAVSKLR